MTTIRISQSSCTKDGRRFTFSGGNGVERNGNTYIISSAGIIGTRKGVVEVTMLPWDEIDKLVGEHEPKLAVIKKV